MDIVYQAVDGSASALSAKLDYLTASSVNLQLRHFVAVQDRDTLRQLGSLPEAGRHSTESTPGADTPKRSFFDYAPLHLFTTAKLAPLHQFSPASRFDTARFRPNRLLDLRWARVFGENGWSARLHVGANVVLQVDVPTPRSAIPTLAQPGCRRIARSSAPSRFTTTSRFPGWAPLPVWARMLNSSRWHDLCGGTGAAGVD